MRQQYYDSMAVVRQFRKPDLVVTVTTNPKWKEIQDELLPDQTSSDRPDIVTRVFRMKLNALLDNITKKGIFGKVAALVYVVEFQNSGLPHAHILIILKDHWKPRNSSDYDNFVSAEIPDLSCSQNSMQR
ncbi:putative membrane protein [Phytophthora megakarya]|uniref:Putative membrane protein n=1 Tax=Phytophthora megakarya TaxID=4795 RepID=A0A225WXU5_9STRA|nr:putative membrane protein [Phytophthora megakarya]